jgi:uncharacterized protein YbjT (DUF2867 family)
MILITGATGTVGSEVVKRLSAQGMQVRAVTRALRKAEASPVPHVEFVKGDFDDPDSMRRLRGYGARVPAVQLDRARGAATDCLR